MRAIVLSLSVIGVLLLMACSSATPEPSSPTPPVTDQATTEPKPPVRTDVHPGGQPEPAASDLLSGTHTVMLKTSKGQIVLELNADLAPKTVTNFVTHAKNGYYDNLTFHRVIKDFMIQGGDPSGNGTGGESIWGESFEDEINAEGYGLHEKKLSDVSSDPLPDHAKDWTVQQYYEAQGYQYDSNLSALPMERGYIAMANRGPNTNGSQFFIIHAESTEWLEGKHTVFGNVVEGMDIVDAIAEVEVGAGSVPIEEVTFTAKAQ